MRGEEDTHGRVREAEGRDAEQIARVHIESSDAAYRGVLPDKLLDEMTFERRLAHWTRAIAGEVGEFVYVAEDDGGRVFGFASGGASRTPGRAGEGELYTVYVLPGDQRRGAGRALVRAVADRLSREAFGSLRLFVLAENTGARFFYHSLGGKSARGRAGQRDGRVYLEIAYVWEDLPELCERLSAR
jgi:ribosomal protein S18 acetylase RimI-like enzyme